MMTTTTTTDKFWSEKLTWAFSLGKQKNMQVMWLCYANKDFYTGEEWKFMCLHIKFSYLFTYSPLTT